MARRTRITLGNAFLRLPLNLAREVALYLKPFRIECIQKLVDLVGVFPTCYLSISLEFALNAADRDYVAELLNDETDAALTFDVSINCMQGRLDTDLLRFSCIPQGLKA